MNIVELYSGSSNFSKEMRQRGHKVVDIDISRDSPAKKHLDITKLSFKDLENMFDDHRVDFIFAAPDVFAYFGLPVSRESLLFKNILNKANCGYVVEQIAFPPKNKYRQSADIIDLNYVIFEDEPVKRFSHLATNCLDLKNYLEDRLKEVSTIKDKDYFSNFHNGTPHKLILILADFIENKYSQDNIKVEKGAI